ncbi:MAG: HTTM domain-containing protein [Myxococcales bacterium]|nr:HTTM domain-containing protein [Myxococcales bacterium]
MKITGVTTWLHRIANETGSTRGAALLRMGVALLIWARFADDLALYHARPWPWGALGASIYLSSFTLLIGWRSRLSALWAAGSIAAVVIWLGVIQRHHDYVHHHITLLLIVTVLLALTPCGHSLSVDRWRALKRGDAPPEVGPLWGVRLMALQASAVWFWGATNKLHAGWFSGDRLQAIWMHFYFGSDMPEGPAFVWLSQAGAVLTVALEYILAVGLWFPRTHRVLIPAALLFHGAAYFTLPVSTFTATMYLLLLAFIPAQRLHAGLDRLLR